MNKTLAGQYFILCSRLEFLIVLCEEKNISLKVDQASGTREWKFEDGSTIEVTKFRAVRVDGGVLKCLL